MSDAVYPQTSEIPSHVPPELVRDYRYDEQPGFESDPQGSVAALQEGPPVFYARDINRDGRNGSRRS